MAGLGRGLGSLLSESKKAKEENAVVNTVQSESTVQQQNNENIVISENSVVKIDINKLKPSVYQPRKNFDNESLNELALSIKEHGLLEPLLVKKADDMYEIICGERRYRACKLALLDEVPCLVRDDLEINSYAIALIENIQREDLNPLEMAQAFDQMISQCSITQEELAKTLGKSRSTVTNILRLNNLQNDVKQLVASKQIDLGHAKVLLGLEDENEQLKAALYVIKKSLNVRQTEALVKDIKENGFNFKKENTVKYTNESFSSWANNISVQLSGIKAKFSAKNEDKGSLTLSYSSRVELERLLSFFKVESNSVSEPEESIKNSEQDLKENIEVSEDIENLDNTDNQEDLSNIEITENS